VPPELPVDPLGILAVLVRHGIRFVVVGGVAGNLHGSPLPTKDTDVTPEPSEENLERTAAALRELNARVRVDDAEPGLDFDSSGASLRKASIWNLRTDLGDLDLVIEPAGTQGYADLRRDATEFDLGDGLRVQVASVPDLIRMKEASGRAKDAAGLPALRAVLERIERER
jgi:hypothetical protein